MRDEPPSTRAVQCFAVRPGPGDPLESLSRALRESGLRTVRVHRKAGRITGRIELPNGAPGWRVDVSLYPRPDECLVEIACEAAGASADLPGPDVWAVWLKMGVLGSLPPGRQVAEGSPPPPAGDGLRGGSR